MNEPKSLSDDVYQARKDISGINEEIIRIIHNVQACEKHINALTDMYKEVTLRWASCHDMIGEINHHIGDLSHMREKIGRLEKHLMEPIAQNIVHNVQKFALDTINKSEHVGTFDTMFNTLIALRDGGHLMTMTARKMVLEAIDRVSKISGRNCT
jgi:hypothetical protein